MSEQENKETETKETNAETGFSIKFAEISDPNLKSAVEEMVKQNQLILEQNKEMKEIITKQQTEREMAKFEKARTEKLEALEKLHPALAKQHKDTKDLGILQTAIDTAKAVKKNFPEYQEEKDKEEASKSKSYVAPKMYKS